MLSDDTYQEVVDFLLNYDECSCGHCEFVIALRGEINSDRIVVICEICSNEQDIAKED